MQIQDKGMNRNLFVSELMNLPIIRFEADSSTRRAACQVLRCQGNK